LPALVGPLEAFASGDPRPPESRRLKLKIFPHGGWRGPNSLNRKEIFLLTRMAIYFILLLVLALTTGDCDAPSTADLGGALERPPAGWKVAGRGLRAMAKKKRRQGANFEKTLILRNEPTPYVDKKGVNCFEGMWFCLVFGHFWPFLKPKVAKSGRNRAKRSARALPPGRYPRAFLDGRKGAPDAGAGLGRRRKPARSSRAGYLAMRKLPMASTSMPLE